MPFQMVFVLMLVSSGLFAETVPAADFTEIRFTAAELALGSKTLRDVQFELEAQGGFVFRSGIFEDLSSGLRLESTAFDGELKAFELPEAGLQANGLLRFGPLETDWYIRVGESGLSLCLLTVAQPLSQVVMQGGIPEQAAWLKEGEVDACIRYRQAASGAVEVDYDFAVTRLAFDSPDGRYAADSLKLDIYGKVRFEEPLSISVEGAVSGGEILLDSFYTNFAGAPLDFKLFPDWQGSRLSAADLELNSDSALRLLARLTLPDENEGWDVDISELHLYFPAAYHRYLEPLAAALTLDGLQVTGDARWKGKVTGSQIVSGDLDISGLSVVDTHRNRFALTGLNASLRPGDYAFDSKLAWRGLLLGRINLGSGMARLDAEPGAFALIEPLELDVLGGRLRLDELKYAMPASPAVENNESRFEMQASLLDVDMEQLTAALGWPGFSGRLSGNIPGARLENGVLSVDGEVRVEVFGGSVLINDLAAERLFGVAPSFAADIRLHDLDLEQLTETFEFGRIIGRVDGYVSGLRMLDWQPVAFDAWLGTPERQGRSSSISRQAVNNLTSIGGGGATAALTGPIMRMFNNFSYRRLGLGCRLQNNICDIRGVSEDGNSVLLLEGAGVPKITVRAWNRSVDWQQMVANLSALASGESVQIGEAPKQ